MAGGLGGGGVPLHARTRAGAGRPGDPSPAAHVERPTGPAKHCWVRAPVDAGSRRPGLLLEWRKDEIGRWEGRVVYVAQLRPDTWVLVEEWLAADLLSTA